MAKQSGRARGEHYQFKDGNVDKDKDMLGRAVCLLVADHLDEEDPHRGLLRRMALNALNRR